MRKYSYKGNDVDEIQIQERADSYGMTFDEYLSGPGSEIISLTDTESIIDDEGDDKKDKKENKPIATVVEDPPPKSLFAADKEVEVSDEMILSDINDGKTAGKVQKSNADQTQQLKNFINPTYNRVAAAKREKELNRLMNDLVVEKGDEVIVKSSIRDGKEYKQQFDKKLFESYFDKNSKNYNPSFVKEAASFTGLNPETITLDSYIKALNKVNPDVNWSVSSNEGGEVLETTKRLTGDVSYEENKSKIILEKGFDFYFDEMFLNNRWNSSKGESVDIVTLQQALPPTGDGSLFKLEETNSDDDNDAIKITNHKGESVVVTVGKDGMLFGGESKKEYEPFKYFIKNSTFSDEDLAMIGILEGDDLTDFVDLATTKSLTSWRAKTGGLRNFAKNLEAKPVNEGGIGFSPAQSEIISKLEKQSYADMFGNDPEYNPVSYTDPNAAPVDFNTPPLEPTGPTGVTGVQGVTGAAGATGVESDFEEVTGVTGPETDIDMPPVEGTGYVYRSELLGGYVNTEDIKNDPNLGTDFLKNRELYQQTKEGLIAQFKALNLPAPTQEFIMETAKNAVINEKKKKFYEINIEKWIEKADGLSNENFRQGSMIAASLLNNVEDEIVLGDAILKKEVAQEKYDSVFEKYSSDVNNRLAVKFLFGESQSAEAMKKTGININSGLYSGGQIPTDRNITLEDGYVAKTVDGERKIQFIEAGTYLNPTWDDGEPVETITSSVINNYTASAQVLFDAGNTVSIYNNEYSKVLEDIPTFREQMSIWQLNYNDTQRFLVKLGIMGLATAKNIVYFGVSAATYTNPYYWAGVNAGFDPMESVRNVNAQLSSWLDEEKMEYNFSTTSFADMVDTEGKSAWDVFFGFGEWITDMTAETLPIVAAMILSGGSASYGQILSSVVAGASSGGGKFSEMDVTNFMINEELSELESRDDIDFEEKEKLKLELEDKKIGRAEYIAKGSAYFAVEGTCAYLTTSAQISDAYSVIRGNGNAASNLFTGTGQYLKKKAPEWFKSANLEGIGEVGVTMGTNLVDGRPIMDGAVEAYAGGFVLGGVFEGIPMMHAYINADFATNAEINSINETNLKIYELSNKKDILEGELQMLNSLPAKTTVDGINKIEQSIKIAEELETINSEINEQAGLLMTKQLEVESKLVDNGITNAAGKLASENALKISEYKIEARNIIADAAGNLSADQKLKLDDLDKKYNNLLNIQNKLKSKRNFGNKFIAMKGKAIWDSKTRKEVQKIEQQAIENIIADKGPLVDGPTAREIEIESIKIVDTRDYNINLDKARTIAKKKGIGFFNFETNKEAKSLLPDILAKQLNALEAQGLDIDGVMENGLTYKEYIEQQITDALDGIESGDLNGYYDQLTNTQFTFKENAINNQKPGVPLHELSHGITIELIKQNPEAFNMAGQVIVDFLSSNYSDLWLRMQAEGTNRLQDGQGGFDYDEVISSFVEEVAAGKIDPKLNKAFTAYLGKQLSNGLQEAGGYEIDFKGVNDVAQFLLGLGQDLSKSKFDRKLLDQAKETKVINIADKTTSKAAASRTKKSSQSKAELIAENKKLLADKPKGYMDKIKSNAKKIKDMISGAASAPSSAMDGGKEPGSREGKNAKKNINEAFNEVKNEWPAGSNRNSNPVVDNQRNPFIKKINQELDGMIEAKARSFRTKDGSVVNLLNNVDLNELQQAVKLAMLPDIRGFNKTNTSLYGYLNSRLSNRIGDVLKSGEVFNDFSTKDLDGLVGKETKSLASEQQATIENELSFREGLNIEEGSDLYNDIKSKVETVLGGSSVPKFEYTRKKKGQKDTVVTLKEALEIKKDPNASKADKNQADIDIARIYKDVRLKLKNAYDTVLFTQIKQQMGTGANYETYLKDIQESLLSPSGLPISELVAMERLSKDKIFAVVEKENISPSDIAKYEGSGRLVYTSKTSGPTLYKRLNPTPDQFVEFFKKRGRKDALAKNMAGKLGLDATMDVLGNPDVIEKMTLGNPELKTLNADELINGFAQVAQQGLGTKFSRRFLDSDVDQNTKDMFLNKRQTFFNRLKYLGVTSENVTNAWNDVYGKKSEIPSKWATQIKNEYKKLVSNLVGQKETYPGIELEIDTYVSSLEMAMEEGDINASKKMLGLPNEAAAAMFQDDVVRKVYEKAMNTVVSKMIEADGTTEAKLNVGINFIKYKGLISKGSNKYVGAKDKGNGVLYGDKDSYIKNFLEPMFGITDYTTKSINKEPYIIVEIDGETVTLPYNVPPQKVSESMIDGSITDEQVAKREEAADDAWNFINETYALMADIVKDPQQQAFDNRMLLMLNASMSASMDSPLAMAAPLRFIPVDPKYKGLKKPGGGKAYEYEHGLPRRVVNLFLLDYHFNKGKGYIKNEADLQKLKESYTVGIIDVDMDNNFGKFFKSRAYFGYQLGDLPTTRWYNMFTKGGEVHAVRDLKTGKIYGEGDAKLWKDIQESGNKTGKQNETSGVVGIKKSSNNNNFENVQTSITLDNALDVARDPNAEIKKIRVFDFDDTLARTNSNVLYTAPDGTKGKLNAEEFATDGAKLLSEGYKFDFSEFNKVVDGKRGPLFDVAEKIRNARGNEDLFVLTARAPEAAPAIYEFLKSEGLEFKLENIIGLGNSTGEAKAEWLVGKAAEGFNDFYFADDAMQNVDAVKLAMSQLDVKSKVQQAKIKFSRTVDQTMNDIIYDKTGIESYKEYSSMRAKARGRTKNSWSLIPPSAQDFGGLLYKLLAKGEKGEAQWQWMQDNLIKPFSRGMNDLSVAQNQLMADFKTLKNSLDGIPKNLKKKAFGGFTYEDVTRIAAWDRQGIKVDGLSDRDLNQIRDFVEDNGEIDTFVNQLIAITKQDGYHYPGGDWLAGTITTDFLGGLRKETRPRVLEQWNQNIDLAFNEKTLNKLEAAFGSKYREAIEDSIRRMKTGQNRKQGASRLEQRFTDYINNSVGAVMFLNARSAVLQTISAVNFVNWTDNNPLKAGKAFANQKQYWTDFMSLMNSDFLVDRRNGLKINVSESEIAEAAKTTGNSVKGVISYLLNKGFVLTQFADSFAIATGGATFYRNRINTYVKQGMSQADAEAKAFLDFRDTAEESQQSARPDKISQQQASNLGRLVLAFANTPSQYARIMDKAGRDLINNRGDWKSNVSKILYYGFAQNLLFTALQSALMFTGFGNDEEEIDKDTIKTANSMLDNILRGIGVQGVILSTVKNTIMDLYNRSKKEGTWPGPEYSDADTKLLEVSPPISIKLKKFSGGLRDYEMNSWRPEANEPFNINNPSYRAAAKVISAVTNVPVDRLFQKVENIQGALDDTNETWQRVAMLMGWPKWQLENKVQREERYAKEAQGRKEYRAEVKKRSTRQYYPKKLPTTEEYKAIELEKTKKTLFKLKKAEQIDSLRKLGLTTDAIKRLKYEEDRVNKIIELNK